MKDWSAHSVGPEYDVEQKVWMLYFAGNVFSNAEKSSKIILAVNASLGQ